MLIVLAGLTALLVFLTAIVVYVTAFYKPNNQAEDNTLPFSTEGSVAPPSYPDESNADSSGEDAETVNGIVTLAPPTTETPPQNDKKDDTFNFLIMGKDRVAVNTDVMILMNYNITQKRISVLQLPRDTYLELDGKSYKLNSLYGHFANEANRLNKNNSSSYSIGKVVETLEKNLCINIHYHAMLDLDGFCNIVDILGGVEVDLPTDITHYDEENGTAVEMKKGKHLLDGKKAETFIRFRSGYVQGDIGRLDGQKIFMSALLKKVKENFNIITIVRIANEVYKHIKTDINIDDMVYFAKNLLSIDFSNIKFMSMPGYDARSEIISGEWYFVMNRRAMLSLINKYYNIYSFSITDSIFDPKRTFTSISVYPHINSIYLASPSTALGGESSAEDINKGNMNIPLV